MAPNLQHRRCDLICSPCSTNQIHHQFRKTPADPPPSPGGEGRDEADYPGFATNNIINAERVVSQLNLGSGWIMGREDRGLKARNLIAWVEASPTSAGPGTPPRKIPRPVRPIRLLLIRRPNSRSFRQFFGGCVPFSSKRAPVIAVASPGAVFIIHNFPLGEKAGIRASKPSRQWRQLPAP